MAHRYLKTMFTDSIRSLQEKMGSRKNYERAENISIDLSELSDQEASFIENRDSFYMATVTEEGWPYVQHRGGPKGFVKILSPTQIAFSDYTGNRQYISLGNVETNKRVSMIFVDYPNQRRLKIIGKATIFNKDAELSEQVVDKDYKAKVERLWAIDIIGFDWNCPQHITPRYTIEDIDRLNMLQNLNSHRRS